MHTVKSAVEKKGNTEPSCYKIITLYTTTDNTSAPFFKFNIYSHLNQKCFYTTKKIAQSPITLS